MDRFRIGLSQGIRRADGRSLIPEFDLSPVDDDPRFEVIALPEGDRLPREVLDDLDAVILMLEKIDDTNIHRDGRLGLIARFGVGYDQIDVDACTRAGVALAITPQGVRRPVAVAVMTFMLALTGRLFEKDRLTREGPAGWARKTDYHGTGLVGRTFGSLGFGNIGAETFRMAAPFDMRFIAHDPYPDEARARDLGVELVDLDTLFRESDVLSITCLLNEDTRGLVDARLLGLMKPTAYLINTSRGPVVDQAALTDALRRRAIAGAGLDVFESEPVAPDEPLLDLDNVMLAPHALCWTDQCMAGIGAGDIEAVMSVIAGEPPAHTVNRAVVEDARFRERLAGYANRFRETGETT